MCNMCWRSWLLTNIFVIFSYFFTPSMTILMTKMIISMLVCSLMSLLSFLMPYHTLNDYYWWKYSVCSDLVTWSLTDAACIHLIKNPYLGCDRVIVILSGAFPHLSNHSFWWQWWWHRYWYMKFKLCCLLTLAVDVTSL